jgi:hypothetical protein
MSIRSLVAVALVWALSLVGIAVWAQGNPPSQEQLRVTQPSVWDEQVISGANFGFIPVATPGDKAGKVSGRFVVKIDGKWIDAVPMVGITR